ncbi:hypothetical protein FHG87_014309 [Trinorchestia longiramus]|nr:hypothetical protein FHG87_014309 [Trinorchestia longiramus]
MNGSLLCCRVVAVVGILRCYGGALLTVLTMTYMATRLIMAMATWLSIVSTIITSSLITAGDPRNLHHRSSSSSSSYESTNVFDLHTHDPRAADPRYHHPPTNGPHYPPTYDPHSPTNVLDGDREGGVFGDDFTSRCPPRCACFGETVDCARREPFFISTVRAQLHITQLSLRYCTLRNPMTPYENTFSLEEFLPAAAAVPPDLHASVGSHAVQMNSEMRWSASKVYCSVSQRGPYGPPGCVEEMQGGGRRVRLEWGAYITV